MPEKPDLGVRCFTSARSKFDGFRSGTMKLLSKIVAGACVLAAVSIPFTAHAQHHGGGGFHGGGFHGGGFHGGGFHGGGFHGGGFYGGRGGYWPWLGWYGNYYPSYYSSYYPYYYPAYYHPYYQEYGYGLGYGHSHRVY